MFMHREHKFSDRVHVFMHCEHKFVALKHKKLSELKSFL